MEEREPIKLKAHEKKDTKLWTQNLNIDVKVSEKFCVVFVED